MKCGIGDTRVLIRTDTHKEMEAELRPELPEAWVLSTECGRLKEWYVWSGMLELSFCKDQLYTATPGSLIDFKTTPPPRHKNSEPLRLVPECSGVILFNHYLLVRLRQLERFAIHRPLYSSSRHAVVSLTLVHDRQLQDCPKRVFDMTSPHQWPH